MFKCINISKYNQTPETCYSTNDTVIVHQLLRIIFAYLTLVHVLGRVTFFKLSLRE